MPRKSSDYRAAVWTLLQDGAWHSILDLIQVGGVRAASRIHELRHDEGRRIVNRVVDGKSSYRYLCNCGPLPEAGAEAECCDLCRPVLVEMGIKVPAPPAAHAASSQLGLFKGAA